MLKTPAAGNRPSRNDGGQPRDIKRILLILVVILTTALVVGVTTVLVLRQDDGAAPSGPGTVPSATATRTVTTTREPAPSASATTSTGQPTAADALRPFLASALTLDRQLRAAAAAVNGAGPPWTNISPDVARTVRAADLEPVARAIPAGLPHELLQSVILVLSDLSSRRYALASFEAHPLAPPHETTAILLSELRNGHAAAARFDRDVASVRALAASTPPIAAVPRQSRLTAEALLLVRYVKVANAGCDSRGGAVITRLPEIHWAAVPGAPEADGTIGDVAFSAELGGDGTWEINLFAC